jgi:hypothetical protein
MNLDKENKAFVDDRKFWLTRDVRTIIEWECFNWPVKQNEIYLSIIFQFR